MADHWILIPVPEDGFENRESLWTLYLSEAVCKLMLEECRVVREAWCTVIGGNMIEGKGKKLLVEQE